MKRLLKTVTIAVLVVACALLITACTKTKNPYSANEKDGYTVNVRYDANGGTFATNTTVITDSYNPDDFPSGSIPLIAPDNSARGDKAMSAKLSGYFLAGWYTERTEVTDGEGNTSYTYSGHWNFESDRLSLNEIEGGTVTLYAAWVPEFSFEFYDLATGELIGSRPASYQESITLPAFNQGTGKMEKKDFPDTVGKTYNRDGGIYTDAAGTLPVTGESVTHSGVLNLDNATASGETMKLYIDLLEGSHYWITTPEQLIAISDPSAHYEIESDLDFEGKRWPFTGNFTGSIDGNGHAFKNITAKQSSQSQQAGLFATVAASAKITSLNFENVSFTVEKGSKNSGPAYGLFAGRILEGATVENVTVTGTLTICSSALNGALTGNGDHTVGLVCGAGYEYCDIDYSGITVAANNDDRQYVVNLSTDGNTVIWVREKPAAE